MILGFPRPKQGLCHTKHRGAGGIILWALLTVFLVFFIYLYMQIMIRAFDFFFCSSEDKFSFEIIFLVDDKKFPVYWLYYNVNAYMVNNQWFFFIVKQIIYALYIYVIFLIFFSCLDKGCWEFQRDLMMWAPYNLTLLLDYL